MAKQTDLQKAYEAALLKGLTSDTAAERVAAIKAVSDRENPNLTDLQTKLRQSDDRLDEAKSSLKEITTERDTLAAKVVELQPLADKAGELDTLRAENETWKADQIKLLTADSQAKLFSAQAVLRASEETLREADNKVSSSGWQELRSTLADLIARYEIPQPSFWETSNAMPSAFFTLWPDWTPRRAAVWCAFKSSWSTDSPEFRAAGLRVFIAAQEVFPGEPPRDVVPDLAERKSFFEVQSKRFGNGCYEEIAKQSEQFRIQRHGQFLRNHNMQMAVQELDHAAHGLTREEQTRPVQSITGCPPSEHLLMCECPLCSPGLRHRNSIDEVEL